MKKKREDQFDIKQDGNSYNSEHRTIEEMRDPCGETSPYRSWVIDNGGYDPISLEEQTDQELPWQNQGPSETVQDQWDAFRSIFPSLTKRQQDVVKLLLSGQVDQTAIGAMLGIPQSRVAKTLFAIRKKIIREMGDESGETRIDLGENNETENRDN